MTKISNQYSLTNILTADLANSRLGINNVSPAYSLDLTGTARVSGVSTFSSNVGVGVVPQTWYSTVKAIQFSVGGALWGIGASNNIFSANEYLDATGTSKYIDADAASRYQQNAGNHVWSTAGSGTAGSNISFSERMRITSTGNVGIGSTTAGAQLTLAQNNPNTSAQTYLTFRNLATNYGSWAIWKTDDNNLGFYYGINSDTPSAGINMKLRYNGVTDFYTQVCIGTSTTGVYGSPLSMANASSTAKIWSTGPNTGGDYIVYSNSGGGIVGVYVGYGATSWTGASDIRLKNIIEPIDNAVDKLLTLNPIVFSWKHDSENKENLGLIAQDIEKVFPQIVDTQNDEIKTKGVRYTELIPVLVKAIQELSAKVSLLENK